MAPQSPQRSSRLGAGVPLALALRFYRSWTSALMRLRAATSTSLLLTQRHEHLKRAGPPRPPRLRVCDRDPSKCASVLSVDDHRRRGGRDVHTRGTVELGLPPEFFRRPPGRAPRLDSGCRAPGSVPGVVPGRPPFGPTARTEDLRLLHHAPWGRGQRHSACGRGRAGRSRGHERTPGTARSRSATSRSSAPRTTAATPTSTSARPASGCSCSTRTSARETSASSGPPYDDTACRYARSPRALTTG